MKPKNLFKNLKTKKLSCTNTSVLYKSKVESRSRKLF